MSSFPKTVAYIFLTLQCLMPCISSDKSQEDLKTPESYKQKETHWEVNLFYAKIWSQGLWCAAAWIGEKHLISAASCFEEQENLNLKSMMDNYFTVEVKPMFKFANEKYGPGLNMWGRAVVHPLYKTKLGRKFPIAYDVALIRVDFQKKSIKHSVADLCSDYSIYKDFERQIWTVVGIRIDKDRRRGPAHGYKPDEFYTNVSIYQGEERFIDPTKQFTMHLEDPHKNKTREQKKNFEKNYVDDFKKGGPVFVENPKESKSRCIAGIVSSHGFKDVWKTKKDKVTDNYITATKVVDLLDWIDHTKKVLDARAKSTKIRSGVRFTPTQIGAKKFQRQWWKDQDKNQQIDVNFKRAGSKVNTTIVY